MTDPEFSVIICTLNRASQLPLALDALSIAVDRAQQAIEVILVNNGSTDNTQQVMEDWAAKQSVPVRIVVEERRGLSCARNAGLAAARGRIIVMTDDDCTLEPDYFDHVRAAYARDSREVIRGGMVTLGDDRDIPFTTKLDPNPAELGPVAMPSGFIIGANFTMQRAVAERIGKFDERFGAGAPFIGSDDTDYLVRAQNLGVPILYDPTFRVAHYHGRRGMDQARKMYRGYGFGNGALFAKHLKQKRVRAWMAESVRAAIRDILGKTEHDLIDKRDVFKLKHHVRGFVAYIRHRG
ncbi:glycosyltransferase family 2 protein [Sphingomonas sp. Leaf10]|uniref:glycosyltransferase family 2 protein n=1 Tax=Sphingomonas sp. Leaf10 TaxID=1735676 RepID=UPI0006FE8349|nr:glycosyltransferase family 2 protein [Sphingomonas sp. Leaf10]KQM35942.1 hypothetical protein ASE59_16955 [Sphingomonas sp. Leaf10]